MINANELMVGNWVNAEVGTTKNPKQSFLQINAVYTSTPLPSINAYIVSYGRTIDLRNLSPIPLTPEILEKCGFVKSTNPNKDVWYLQFTREYDSLSSYIFIARLKEDPDGMYYFGFESPMSAVNVGNVYHLHQVQNIVHALTGEELTVNL